MEFLYKILMMVGAFNIGFGLISLFIKEKCYLSESFVATIIGGILGKNALNLVDFTHEISETFIFQFSRIVINLQVVAVGTIVPKEFFRRAIQSIFVLLCPLMVISWVTASLIIKYVGNLNFADSFLVGACVTPTDPVLASGILKGKFANRYVPPHLRKLLAFESGANDGLGLPLLGLSIHYLIHKNKTKEIYSNWFFHTWLYEIGLAVALGILFGIFFRFLLLQSKKYNMIDKESTIVYILALAFFVTGVTAMIKIDDIFACFISGIVFNWYHAELTEEIKESQLMEILDMICSMSFFIFFGNVVSPNCFTLRNILIAVLVIILRRLPYVILLKRFIPLLYNNKEVFFAGWYGPIGVGAIFLGQYAKDELQHSKHGCIILSADLINLIHMIVLASILIHGITAPIVHFHLRKSSMIPPEKLYELSEYSETEGNNPEKNKPFLTEEEEM